MSVAWVAVGAAAVGTIASANAQSNAVDAQQSIADQAAAGNAKALDAQIRQADELLAFNKEQFAAGQARQIDIDAITKRVVEQNLNLSEKAGQRADESYQFYQENGRPVVEQTLEEAKNYDSAGNIAAARARAQGDVQQGFDNAEQQSQRALTRMGINPSSGRFMALQQRLQADKAAALAQAGTGAENARRDGGIQLRQQASNLAQGFPAQSLAQGGQSSGTANSAAGASGASAVQNNMLAATALNGMSAGAGIYGNVASGYQNTLNGANNQINNINAQAAQSQAGWGQLAGMGLSSIIGMADGGKVKGPGTGTSDEVPAVNADTGGRIQLSNGEYVLSADTVKAVGTKFLDNLQAKHHKPVNLGRA